MTIADAIALVDRLVADHNAATDHVQASTNYDAWRKAHREADAALASALVAAGATVRENWQGASVKLAGVRSTSTGGLRGATTNWLRAAQQRLEA